MKSNSPVFGFTTEIAAVRPSSTVTKRCCDAANSSRILRGSEISMREVIQPVCWFRASRSGETKLRTAIFFPSFVVIIASMVSGKPDVELNAVSNLLLFVEISSSLDQKGKGGMRPINSGAVQPTILQKAGLT